MQHKHLVRKHCTDQQIYCRVLVSTCLSCCGWPGAHEARSQTRCMLPTAKCCQSCSLYPSHHVLTWQVRDTLGALAERCTALKIDGAALHVSRLTHAESRGLAVKRITMYSPNWVKSQNRMSSTSNQVRCPMTACFIPRICVLGLVRHMGI